MTRHGVTGPGLVVVASGVGVAVELAIEVGVAVEVGVGVGVAVAVAVAAVITLAASANLLAGACVADAGPVAIGIVGSVTPESIAPDPLRSQRTYDSNEASQT